MDDKLLQEDEDLADVQELLHGADSKWKAIGIQLKLPFPCLEKIGKEHGGNIEECSLQMQIAWLRSKTATWKSLIAALRKSSVGFEEKARDIEKKKLSQSGKDKEPTFGQLPPNMFLTEHLEWLLKIGCSVDNIMEWAARKKLKEQNQAVEMTSCNGMSSDIPESSYILPGSGRESSVPAGPHSLGNSEQQVKTKPKKRQNPHQNKKPRHKKRPRSEENTSSSSQVQFTAIDACTERGKQLQIKQNMLQIIKKLKKHPDAKEFIHFVKEERAEGYYKIIKYPMCLTEIEDRINRHQCDSREIFCEEFDAIVENCIKYNGLDSRFTEQVKRLKAQFDELVKVYLPDGSYSINMHSLPPLETVRFDGCWPLESSSEHSSSDEEYNALDDESTFESREDDSMTVGAGDLSESSQELFHGHSCTDKVTTETHLCDSVSQLEPRSTLAMENSVKVEDTSDLQERAIESESVPVPVSVPVSVPMNTLSGDEDSENDPPSIRWK